MTGRSAQRRARILAVFCGAVLAAAACSGSDGKPSAAPPSAATAPATGGPAPKSLPAAFQRVVPEPVTVAPGSGTFPLTDSAVIRTNPGAEAVGHDLAGYLRTQTGLALPVNGDDDPSATPGTIVIDLRAAGTDPVIGAEGYQLDVTATGVKLTANSAAGLFHGVQTIRQLLLPGSGGQPATLPAGHVTDFPRYAYRGGMLDVARHFLGVSDVRAYIDALALYKINYFHLHLTDDQGWRFEVPGYPKLISVGAATSVGGGPGGHYTDADVESIVDYAASRFMTVVPEIDMPGHTMAATAAYPDLSCDGRPHPVSTAVSPGFNALCPSKESTSTFVGKSLTALAALTPGPYLHIGGDEAQSLTPEQYATFVGRSQELAAGTGKTPMAWAEVTSAPLRPGTVAVYWNTKESQPFVADAAAKGTRLVMAPANHAYLDQKYSAGFPLGLQWAGFVSVPKAYDWDPATVLPGVPPTAVLGVEAPLWTETVANLADAETLAFPRLPAIAEIGWSTPATHDWTSFDTRLGRQAALWDKLGIKYYKAPEVTWGG